MWITKSEYDELIIENSQLKTSLKECKETSRRTYMDLVTENMQKSELKYKINELELGRSDRDAEIRNLKDKIEGMEVKSLRYQEFYRSESSNNAKKIYSLEEEIKALKKQSTKKPTKEAEPKLPEDTTVIKITANDKSGNIDVMVESRLQNKAIFCGVLDYAKDAIIKNHLYHKTKPE